MKHIDWDYYWALASVVGMVIMAAYSEDDPLFLLFGATFVLIHACTGRILKAIKDTRKGADA